MWLVTIKSFYDKGICVYLHVSADKCYVTGEQLLAVSKGKKHCTTVWSVQLTLSAGK